MKESIHHTRKIFAGVALSAAMILTGCTNSEQKPTGTLTQAETIVDQADRAGTRKYAAFDLSRAHIKLDKAREAMNEKHYKKARYLAKEAKVDAELAIAKTQTKKTKEAETQLKQSMQLLQNEIDSNGNTPQ